MASQTQQSSMPFIWRIVFALSCGIGGIYLMIFIWTKTGGTLPISADHALEFLKSAIEKTGGQLK